MKGSNKGQTKGQTITFPLRTSVRWHATKWVWYCFYRGFAGARHREGRLEYLEHPGRRPVLALLGIPAPSPGSKRRRSPTDLRFESEKQQIVSRVSFDRVPSVITVV